MTGAVTMTAAGLGETTAPPARRTRTMRPVPPTPPTAAAMPADWAPLAAPREQRYATHATTQHMIIAPAEAPRMAGTELSLLLQACGYDERRTKFCVMLGFRLGLQLSVPVGVRLPYVTPPVRLNTKQLELK